MTIKARGNSFMVSFGTGKDRVRKTLPTMEAAEAYEAELTAAKQAKLAASLKAAERGDVTRTLGEARERALKEIWAGSKAYKTSVRNSKAAIDFFGENKPVTEIDSDAIDEYLDHLQETGNTGATINRKLSALMVILRNAKRKGWLKYIPDTQRRSESSGRIYWFTEEQESEMVEVCRKLGLNLLIDFIPFAIDSGFRKSELLRFRVEDFDGTMLHLHEGETKNNSGRVVPATEVVKTIIERAKQKGHDRVFQDITEVNLRAQWDSMREFLGKKKDPKYIVHVLRHTCATRLAIRGATAPQIQAWMGHKAIQTSIRYIHLTGHHLQDVATLLTRTPTAPLLRVVSG